MTIQQIDTGTASLTPTSPVTIYTPAGAGAAVVLLNLRDMAPTDTFIMRHYLTFPMDGNTVVASKIIQEGTTTDETWAAGSVAGDSDAQAWQSWPLGFGSIGGFVELESTSGTFDVEWIVLDLGGPTG